MAAIAKFISYDGGVAFSDKVLKIQKRDQDATIIPLEDVASVGVRRSQEDADGFIRVETVDGRRYRILFENDQLQEAIRFKRSFEASVVKNGFDDDLPEEPEPAPVPVEERRHHGRKSKAKPVKGPLGKMIRCKSCGRDIAKTAKRCPYCGAQQHVIALSICALIVVVTVFAVVAVLVNSGDGSGQTHMTGFSADGNQQEQATEQNDGQMILDQDGIQIYFKGFSEPPAPAKGYYIDLYIENNSDVDYMIQVDDLSVDELMVPFGNYIFSPEVLAGKKLNEHIWVTGTDELGITSPIKSAEFIFRLNKGNNLNNPFVDSGVISIGN